MPDTSPSIRSHQNEPSMITLLRATSVSHARVRRLNSLRIAVAAAIGASGLGAAFTNWTATWIAIAGALWGLAYSTRISSWANGELRRAALLQEMFDVRLFRIPWNSVVAGEELPAHEVSQLNRRYTGNAMDLYDYYEIPELPRPFDVLGCQQQNLGWGARVRRRYANTVLVGTLLWAGMGFLVGVLADLGVAGLILSWYVPSLGILLLGLDTYLGHRKIAAERDRVFSLLQRRIAQTTKNPPTPQTDKELMSLARQVQDAIFHTRTSQARVPDWFFSRFKTKDRIDFQEAMTELVRTITRD